MNPDDLRLQRMVEALLVRNYVDTQRANVEVINGTAYLDGEFHIKGKGGQDDSGDSPGDRIEENYETRRLLLHLEQEIRRMNEIRGITFSFSNWSKSGSGWVPKKGG